MGLGMSINCQYCTLLGQPLSVDLDHRVSELVPRAERQLLSVCNTGNNVMSTSRRGTEEGAYSRDKMSDPAYKPPPTLSTSIKVAKGGAYMRDTTVYTLG